ncbi:transcriptional regulator, GntR family [Streptoalloteichus tenebrarius]|uniref:Transcriptional regulator, GntR family n=1 Tax=Streptoalloteichus tenebrarius (strain ATCC 17920 / DSM 40477 / JCM 4838 / CBS 697.72 / NBRC 16177 / NCIMB 11028 / NRRL B-12390 / A12253. 1 / ISP 5477) TaxID=1933 RepID=A0ABT1HNA9_STRSD|nr:GntR family transcriptional regulator [Streptoalloteichus tenebrarius]MCP2257001.1 transcriptional regulator, GntR family [Streptoalloteichus tenebrarius]BFF00088.1 GntR family transcriptional regulator [Streptoalloteichus tenebrarius]
MTSGRERAYEFLKDAVLTDPRLQGQFVSEQEIADRVGVSRTPVREALLLLAAEDLVRLVPKRGAYVAPVTGREVTELMELRGVLERYAAERVLVTGSAPLSEMRHAVEMQRTLLDAADVRSFAEWDQRFHTALVAGTGNSLLAQVYEGLRARQVRCAAAALYRTVERREEALAGHEAILSALAEGDAVLAGAAITTHLEAGLRVLLVT